MVGNVLRAGTVITLACTASAASCGLVAGGWHGIVVATLLFTSMGLLGMGIGVVVGFVLDGSRAVRERIEGAPLVRSEVLERGAGQLSAVGAEAGALAAPLEPAETKVSRGG